jgi:hypothetical protein
MLGLRLESPECPEAKKRSGSRISGNIAAVPDSGVRRDIGGRRFFRFCQETGAKWKMRIKDTVKENIAYSKELLEAGIEGANSARREVLTTEESSDLLAAAVRKSWQPTALGVFVGAICGVLADDRRPLRGVVAGGIFGAALGFASSFAWETRPLTSAMARNAGKRINEVRDGHWLNKNPINYG